MTIGQKQHEAVMNKRQGNNNRKSVDFSSFSENVQILMPKVEHIDTICQDIPFNESREEYVLPDILETHMEAAGTNENSGCVVVPKILYQNMEDDIHSEEHANENSDNDNSYYVTNLDIKAEAAEETYAHEDHSISTVEDIENYCEHPKLQLKDVYILLRYVSTYEKNPSYDLKKKIANELQVPDKLVNDWFKLAMIEDCKSECASVRNDGTSITTSEGKKIEIINAEQKNILENVYMCNKVASHEVWEKLSRKLSLPSFLIQIWFFAVKKKFIKLESEIELKAPNFEETYLNYMNIDEYHSLQGNKCKICKNKIYTELGLTKHLYNIHNINFYQCNMCDNSYSVKEDFLIHLGEVHEILPHVCLDCGEYIFGPPLFQGHYYLCDKIKLEM